MRYFLFHFSFDKGDGSLAIAASGFPPEKQLEELIREDNKVLSEHIVSIVGWTEFKSARDYKNFVGGY